MAETRNGGTAEDDSKSLKMESRDGRKFRPEILKDGMMENHSISQEELGKVKKARVCEIPFPCKIIISFVVVNNLLSFRFLLPIVKCVGRTM